MTARRQEGTEERWREDKSDTGKKQTNKQMHLGSAIAHLHAKRAKQEVRSRCLLLRFAVLVRYYKSDCIKMLITKCLEN